MGNLTNKVAIVTGSSRGIGKAIATRLAKNGAAVVINYSHSADKAEATVREIEEQNGKAIAIQADVSQVNQIESLFDRTIDTFGQVDILVNCAGIVVYKPIVEVTEADFDKIFAVNVKGTYFACQQASKRMADGGRIINISSTTTALMLPTYSAYVATKGAVEQVTRVLAKEVGDRGITVNIVSPGPTDTPLFREGKTEEQIEKFASMAALGRIGEVEDIADVVAFLSSDDSRWITGQNIRVNGGLA
ncbi:MAG: SDR family oxidoreductase [Cyanobacteriota bacterium]|nr:SDR family oxidoreductase [Cyanobacteriota bacterium]